MNTKFYTMLLSVIFFTLTAGCSAMLTNERAVSLQDIVYLTQHELSDDVIIKHIENTNSRFDLTTEDIVTLKDAGVSDDVIVAIVERSGPQPPFASEYGRPVIPGTYGLYGPWYPHQIVPYYESYIDYYDTGNLGFPQPVRRSSGLVGRFYEYGYEREYDSASDQNSGRRDNEASSADRSSRAEQDQENDESE